MSAVILALLAIVPQHQGLLTEAEKAEGWKALFDGKSTLGWRAYNADEVGKGWNVEGGVLSVKDPRTAGDIVTEEEFDWFELRLEVNLGKGQNSGILLRVADGSKAAWHSGPEVQIYDHEPGPDVEVTGDLYQLYKAEHYNSKPAGEWNQVRVLWSKEKCATWVNGTQYYEFVFGSENFWSRVAKSKFSQFPEFARAEKGRIGLQGDHGNVSFRNIKIRPIPHH